MCTIGRVWTIASFHPGVDGIGRQFNPLFQHLDKQFTVCSYDRRQFNDFKDSRVAGPKQLNPAQQARDVIAICNALGRDKTQSLETAEVE
jgi:hypothetical protein